jgi:hypothetical protein
MCDVRGVAPSGAVPMKPKSMAQAALMRKSRGTPKGPTKRTPAAVDRPLSPEEKLQEHLEEKRLRRAWDNNELPASLKGYGGA